MTRWIEPSGPRDASVVVVGRDCGWEEIRDGRGFVGQSGKLIWHPSRKSGAADLAGLPRASCLVTNVVNTQPPANDWGKHDAEAVARGSREALALIAEHPRRLVIALGEQAAALCLTGDPNGSLPDSITNTRGYVFADTHCGWPTLVAVHPAFILRSWHPWWATFRYDWQKAARIARAGYQAHNINVQVLNETHEIEQWWNGVAAGSLLANDCETQGLGCIGFATTPHDAVIIPCKPTREHPQFELVQRILNNDKGVTFVLQNGQFDQTMYARAGLVPARSWPQFKHDLMLGWHSVEPLLAGSQRDDSENGHKGKGAKKTEKGLEFLAGLLLDGARRWKNYQFADDAAQFELCGIDCGYTLGAWQQLEKRFAA